MTQREPRLVDPKYLVWLRNRACVVCGKGPRCDAAHIRFGSQFYGKRNVGLGEKPDDRWAVSMCRGCHTLQHSMNEQEYWRERRILVLSLAQKLYAEFGGDGGQPAKKRQKRTTLVPRGFAPTRKFASRPFPRARKIQNRGFK